MITILKGRVKFMRVPQPSVSYDEVKFNLDNGIMEAVEEMMDKQEQQEKEDR